MRKAASSATALLTILFQVGLASLTVWGIYWSFQRHGAGQGVLSVLIPPFAWYRGVAAVWEKPAWQDVWDENTEALGYVIAESGNPKDSKQMLELSQAKAGLRKWIRAVPVRERAELKYATENYVNALTQQARNQLSDVLDGVPGRSSSDPSVAVFVARFQKVKGLASAWKRYDENTTLAMRQMQETSGKQVQEAMGGHLRPNAQTS